MARRRRRKSWRSAEPSTPTNTAVTATKHGYAAQQDSQTMHAQYNPKAQRKELLRLALVLALCFLLLGTVVWVARTTSYADQLAIKIYDFLGFSQIN